MRFWDSSALVALLVEEANTRQCEEWIRGDPQIVTWWLSRIECASAINRLCREGNLHESDVRLALKNLQVLSSTFLEVQPIEAVRLSAFRLLRVHPLHVAAALQLAAAILAAGDDRSKLDFVSYDARLTAAADREGLTCLP